MFFYEWSRFALCMDLVDVQGLIWLNDAIPRNVTVSVCKGYILESSWGKIAMKCGSWAFHHRLRASQDQAGRRCQNGSPESFVRFGERPSTIDVRAETFAEGWPWNFILVAIFVRTFRWRGRVRCKKSQNTKCPTNIICERSRIASQAQAGRRCQNGSSESFVRLK